MQDLQDQWEFKLKNKIMSIVRNKSKRYQSLLKDLDQTKAYKIDEAVKLIKDRSKTKFVESIDVSINLNLDKAKADQTLRTTVDLPHGNGKKNYGGCHLCKRQS